MNLGQRALFHIARLFERAVLGRQIEKFTLVLGGHIFFQTLSAAAHLDLFTLLSQRKRLTRGQIMAELGIAEKPARILLLGCASLGLIRKHGSHYSNAPLAERVLVRGKPQSILPVIQWQHHINYRPMHAFLDAIRQNKNVGLAEFAGDEKTLYERLAHNPSLERIFQDAMQSISVHANDTLRRFVDFSRFRHVVDVGGGNGTNIIALAHRYPHLRCTVFDSPSVCEIARRNIAASPVADRLNAVAGDCFNDPFPRDADCFLFAHFFTIWSEDKNRLLLKKGSDALREGGGVIIFNMMQHDAEDGPLMAALGSPYFLTLATGEGMLYTWSEYEKWMREAGFSSVTRQMLPRDHGAIIGIKGR